MQNKGTVLILLGLGSFCISGLFFMWSSKHEAKPPPAPSFGTNLPNAGGRPHLTNLGRTGSYVLPISPREHPPDQVENLRFATSDYVTNAPDVQIVEMADRLVAAGRTKSIYAWWQPEPNAAGYRVYYGLATRNYSDLQDMGLATNGTISSLKANTVYYFAVTCYLTNGLESAFSDEFVFRTSK